MDNIQIIVFRSVLQRFGLVAPSSVQLSEQSLWGHGSSAVEQIVMQCNVLQSIAMQCNVWQCHSFQVQCCTAQFSSAMRHNVTRLPLLRVPQAVPQPQAPRAHGEPECTKVYHKYVKTYQEAETSTGIPKFTNWVQYLIYQTFPQNMYCCCFSFIWQTVKQTNQLTTMYSINCILNPKKPQPLKSVPNPI